MARSGWLVKVEVRVVTFFNEYLLRCQRAGGGQIVEAVLIDARIAIEVR